MNSPMNLYRVKITFISNGGPAEMGPYLVASHGGEGAIKLAQYTAYVEIKHGWDEQDGPFPYTSEDLEPFEAVLMSKVALGTSVAGVYRL